MKEFVNEKAREKLDQNLEKDSGEYWVVPRNWFINR